MFDKYKKKISDAYREKPHHDKGQDEDGYYESERDMSKKQKGPIGRKPFQERYEMDDDDEHVDKYDDQIEENTDPDISKSIAKKGTPNPEETERRKKFIAIVIKKGMRNRDK